MITSAPDTTFAARRQQLRECIAKMATAIASGDCTPERVELAALVQICQEHFLPVEAARVRRWMAP
jgi:hypothetical protein